MSRIRFADREPHVVIERVHLRVTGVPDRYVVVDGIAGTVLLTAKLLPVVPDETVRDEEEEGVAIQIIHERLERRSQAAKKARPDVERIAGQDFVDKDWS